MKVKIIRRIIALGTTLRCNPMASSFGVPDFLRGHSGHWYSSTLSQRIVGMENLETEGACEHAIAVAEKGHPGKLRVKEFEVTGILKDNRFVLSKCRIEI